MFENAETSLVSQVADVLHSLDLHFLMKSGGQANRAQFERQADFAYSVSSKPGARQ